MLYQKGEKLAELRQTIKDIPSLSGLNPSEFVMSKREFKKFEAPILKLLNNLNTVLFNTLINSKTEDENSNDVRNATNKIFLYLEENFEHDLIDYFYEEKLKVYEKMFVILIRDEMCERFPIYKDVLLTIPNLFWKKRNEYNNRFPKISYLIDVQDEITKDKKDDKDIRYRLYDSTIMYLNHCVEMIYEEIAELVKKQCKEKYLNPDVLPNMLRQLIYLIKSELPIVFEEEENSEND